MIYLYGLLAPDFDTDATTLTALEGVTGEVALANLGPALLVHGRCEETEILPRRRHLLAHARVLETLAGAGAVLPMRFGMITPSIETVAAALTQQKDDLAAQFAAVQGCAEYGIRVVFPRDAALPAAVDGNAALARERSRLLAAGRAGRMETAEFGRQLAEVVDRRRAATQRELVAALAPEFASYVLRAPEEDVQVLAVDALVPDSRADGLGARIEALARASAFAPGAEPQVSIVGPGPAYSFVRLTLELARQAA